MKDVTGLGFVRKVLPHTTQAAGQRDHGCVAPGQFFVASADSAALFLPAKHPLNDVALPILWTIKKSGQARPGLAWHHGGSSTPHRLFVQNLNQ